jgi:hypothetical protein
MATVNAAALTGMIDDSNITNAEAEEIIDHAINMLNMHLYKYDMSIANLSGTAGSKTLTVESRYKGAVSFSSSQLQATIKDTAELLKDHDIEVSVG